MPRPAAKRNRVKQTTGVITNGKERFKDNATHAENRSKPDVEAAAHEHAPTENAQDTRSRTPIAKASEQAIESSPLGERVATGSRPPTRSRGYSSTLSIAGRKGDTSSRIPNTPGFESSILSNFRRRPRQQSILQVMQADDDDSSDMDDEDDLLGGLSPQDESTPLNLSRGKELAHLAAAGSPTQPSIPSSASASSSRKRKRTSVELQVPQSSVGIVHDTPSNSRLTELSDEESDDSIELPLPPPLPQVSTEAFSQTLAPPMSSSAPSSPRHIGQMRGSDHEQTVPPKRQRKSGSKAGKSSAESRLKLSTEALQDRLLPRRRRRQRRNRGEGDLDLPSSEVDDDDHSDNADQDEDELSYLPSRSRSHRKQSSRTQYATKTRMNTVKQNKEKIARPAAETRKETSSGKKVTYASRSSRNKEPDKENQPVEASSPLSSALDSDTLDHDNADDTPRRGRSFMSEELKLQAIKFAEIDQWEMEFEDVAMSQDSEAR